MRGLLIAALALAACSRDRSPPAPAPPPPPEPTSSNIRAADYVGPRKCRECHEDRFESWRQSLHASMNRLAFEAGIIGDFSGVTVRYAGGEARFLRDGHAYLMELGARRFRVTRTIGTRYLQEYVGTEIGVDGPEIRLPFGWWPRAGGWIHQQYFDSWFDEEWKGDKPAIDAFAPDPAPWAARCAWCHNTYAFELRAARDGVGQGHEQYFERLDGTPAREVLPAEALVTVGISCESCHLGGREHAVEGDAISFVPVSPDLRARGDAPALDGGRANQLVLNTVCASCHSTPSPRFASGAVTRNSSEALDMAGGACMTRIRCVDCHDPHGSGPGAGKADGLARCDRCHGDLPADHSRHASAPVSCVDCHMPRIVQGVSDYIRSHRIAVPDAGAPNACNLCHLDRSMAWTAAELARLWGRRVEPPLLADTPAGEVWLRGRDPEVRLVAAAAYGRSPLGRAALPMLVEMLDDPVAHDRMRMLFAIEAVLGRRVGKHEYDPTAPPEERARQVRRWHP